MKKVTAEDILQPSEDDKDLVTLKDMKDNIDLIKSEIPTFKHKFSKVSKTKLEVSNIDIDRIITESVIDANLDGEKTKILNGFYETWMSIFMMVGSDKEALEIVFRMINSQ